MKISGTHQKLSLQLFKSFGMLIIQVSGTMGIIPLGAYTDTIQDRLGQSLGKLSVTPRSLDLQSLFFTHMKIHDFLFLPIFFFLHLSFLNIIFSLPSKCFVVSDKSWLFP